MKKKILALIILTAAFGIYWFFFREKPGSSHVPTQPLAIETNTSGFSGGFGHLLDDYYALKDAFVKSDPIAVDQVGLAFHNSVDSFSVKDIKADTAIISTASSFKESISAELLSLVKKKDLEEKRKSFQVVSDAMYDLIRTVKYDKAMIYQLHCPMAFDNSGANWLSNKQEVINPYFGDKMLNCGDVIDSIDYRH